MYYEITVRLKLFAIEKFRKKEKTQPKTEKKQQKKNGEKPNKISNQKNIAFKIYVIRIFFPVKYIWNDAKKMIRQKKMANQLCNSSTFAMNL